MIVLAYDPGLTMIVTMVYYVDNTWTKVFLSPLFEIQIEWSDHYDGRSIHGLLFVSHCSC